MTLTEKEKAVFEDYCKEIVELEKTDKDRYELLRKAIKNTIGKIGVFDFVFIKAFNLDDKAPCDDDDDLRFELTRARIRQTEAWALRRLRHPRRASNLRDYIENDHLYVIVEDRVPEEEKAVLQNACESFAKRINLQTVNLTFLNAPSELDFSHPDDSKVPKSLFNKNVLLISKSEPCLSWFERACILPLRKDGKPVPCYISVQPKILTPDEALCPPDYHNTVFAYPSFSKIADFKGAIMLDTGEYVPRPIDFDLLAGHFEKKKIS